MCVLLCTFANLSSFYALYIVGLKRKVCSFNFTTKIMEAKNSQSFAKFIMKVVRNFDLLNVIANFNFHRKAPVNILQRKNVRKNVCYNPNNKQEADYNL